MAVTTITDESWIIQYRSHLFRSEKWRNFSDFFHYSEEAARLHLQDLERVKTNVSEWRILYTSTSRTEKVIT